MLWINIDSHLNWKPHVDSIISKVSRKVGLLHRLSRFLSSAHLIPIYTAIIQSCFDYVITIWGSCHSSYLLPPQGLQNRCARICSNNFDYSIPSIDLIKNLKWLKIKERYIYFLGIFMYKYVHKLLPAELHMRFAFVKDSHSYNIRAASSYHLTLQYRQELNDTFLAKSVARFRTNLTDKINGSHAKSRRSFRERMRKACVKSL